MKRSTPEHPKTDQLMLELDLERWQAVGILECLWHFTARFAPRGDVGKWSNERIAEGIGWKGDADKLISALVKGRWIDENPSYRLLIHDWPDHCDQAVKKYLSRNKLRFAAASGRRPAKVRTADGPPLPLPLPLPVPEPTDGDTRARPSAPADPPARPDATPPAQWPAWLAAYGEVYRAAYGRDSEPPWGEMNQFLGPLVAKHDHTVVLARWTRFCRAKTDAQWCRPERFVQSFGQWTTDDALATGGQPPVGAASGRKPTAEEITTATMLRARQTRQGGGGGQR